MVVKITPNDKGNPPGKLADAELHFTDGELDGLKLIGFAIWERRGGGGRNVTFPARQYAVNGDRRSFALLRPITDTQRPGTRARSRAAGVRRVRGERHGSSFVDSSDLDAAFGRRPGSGAHNEYGSGTEEDHAAPTGVQRCRIEAFVRVVLRRTGF